MRGRTGNDSPHSGLNTGSDSCPALPHTSALRPPKDNCQLGKEVSGFTGDLTTGQKQLTPVSVVYSNDCQMALGQPPSHVLSLSCDTGDRAHPPAGAVPGLSKASLVCGLREVSRTGTGANIPAAGMGSVSMANHFLLLMLRDGSLLWTVSPVLHRFHHQQSVPLTRATYYSCSVNTSPEVATELETYTWSCLREQTWDCNSESGKWIRHIKVDTLR